jgi:hypothetical protein
MARQGMNVTDAGAVFGETGGKTVAETKHHNGRSDFSKRPTGVLRSLAAEGGVQLQSCYMPFWAYFIFE